ncbi:MAG: prepilin-type N-terminal cleavage/methylation domain-containing protein [Bacilli bacterium]|nr:prepilin-type N-terminal cleavage/methylation domain-containing protein [Bacilli bacterium]
MKKGFTLIEVLTVIILIGVIGLIAFPAVNSMIKEARENLYNDQMEEIKLAAEKWSYNNIDLLPNNDNESITITLLELKRGGYLPLDIKNPKTDEPFSNGLSIVITYKSNNYEFEIEEDNINTEITEDSPSIIISGESIITVEVNTEYIQDLATATNSEGVDISDDIIITYYDNGKEISQIDTSQLKTYTIEYSVIDKTKNLKTVVTQTVIVQDTIKPEIIVSGELTIPVSLASTYNLLEGVVATDNSNEKIDLQISGYDTSIGEKIVSYKGCDSSGNCNTVNRIITVE